MNNEDLKKLNPVMEWYEGEDGIRVIVVGDLHLSNANPISRKDDYAGAMLNKLYQIGELYKSVKADFVLFTGDIWHTTRQPDIYEILVLDAFSHFEGNAYTVVGNHDIVYARTDTINKTPIGVLLASGYLKRLGVIECVSQGGSLLIQGQDYVELDPKFPESKHEATMKVLLAHNFIYCQSSSFNAPDSFDVDDHVRSCWDLLLVGHDHAILEKKVGTKTVLNPGAVSRGTIAMENRKREVGVYIVDLPLTSKEVQYMFYKLQIQKQEDIYSELSLNRKDVSKKMKEFVQTLADESFQEKAEIEQILEELCGGNMLMLRYIRKHFFDNGVIASL